MMTYERASNEIIQFLEEFPSTPSDLPDAVSGHWWEAIAACRLATPDRNTAKLLCNHILTILRGLRAGDTDFRLIDRAEGRVSILLGAVYLGQQEWQDAVYFFERGIKRLRYWDDVIYESLSYFGKALTFKEQAKWSEALEATQKALDSIQTLAIPSQSAHSKQLKDRIKREITTITKASIEEAKKKPPLSKKLLKPTPHEPIPIISGIAAGLGVIAENDIEDYLFLSDDYRNNADFGVRVVGDSMIDLGIFPGDIALIHQQPTVNNGDIAAVVIILSQMEALGVLKRYYVVNKNIKDLAHWLLESSKSSSEHLVVMPSGATVEKIRDLYIAKIKAGKILNPIKFYKDAEIAIAGKYVGLVRKN
jgi:SOS-response transcriptional repressor LexA